jgi:hypothetical protein
MLPPVSSMQRAASSPFAMFYFAADISLIQCMMPSTIAPTRSRNGWGAAHIKL